MRRGGLSHSLEKEAQKHEAPDDDFHHLAEGGPVRVLRGNVVVPSIAPSVEDRSLRSPNGDSRDTQAPPAPVAILCLPLPLRFYVRFCPLPVDWDELVSVDEAVAHRARCLPAPEPLGDAREAEHVPALCDHGLPQLIEAN